MFAFASRKLEGDLLGVAVFSHVSLETDGLNNWSRGVHRSTSYIRHFIAHGENPGALQSATPNTRVEPLRGRGVVRFGRGSPTPLRQVRLGAPDDKTKY